EYCNDLVEKEGFSSIGVINDDGCTIALSKGFEITPEEFNDIKFILINDRPDHNKGTLTVGRVTYNDVKRTFNNEYIATAAETGCIIAKTVSF
ncbi:hypothetical protein DICPUDRAFT_41353, partial [Dictyostelium purpureum]